MFCRNCGTQLLENSKFCSSCGSKVDGVLEQKEPEVVYAKELNKAERGPWRGFAKTGMTLGIIASLIPIYGLAVMPFGFIFSGLGMNSKENKSKAITGICFSIASIVNFVLFIILMIYGSEY